MKIFFVLFFSLTMAAVALADSCGDDPRLSGLPAMLAAGQMPDEPLTLTAETFFRLQPAVRKALGDKILLCPKVPLKNAKPLLRQKMDFAAIWNAMEIAVALKDWETVELIAQSVQALPLPTEALFTLLVYPTFDEKGMRQLAKILGVPLADADLGWRFFLLDVFFALGGRAEKQETVFWVRDEKQLGQARSVADARKDNVRFIPYSGMHAEQAQNSLRSCGVLTTNADAYIRQ